MARHDVPELYRAIGRKEVFASGYGGGLAALPANLDAFEKFVDSYYLDGEASLAWTVRVLTGESPGRIVGATWMGDFDLRNESTHVGATAYTPNVWGTTVNPEAKLLLLGLAFDHGFGRVKIQADAVNTRSRSAIERLSCRFEGVLRRDQRRADGSWRDTAVYSLLASEWPATKQALENRLLAFGGSGHARESASTGAR
jgi:RimJ/RimL family protein N-acetyltransferase